MSELYIQSQLTFSVGQCSEAGVKDDNEDAIGIKIPQGHLITTKGMVAVIADGVSAAQAGGEASQICVQNFLSDYFSTPESWSVQKSAQQVLSALNCWLYGKSSQFNNEQKGYVSTLDVLIIKSHTAHILHVGDSRVYRFRGGELECLTRDHAIAVSEKQTFLTRAMGLDTSLDVDYKKCPVEEGDVFLMTTDGVHDVLSHEQLCNHLDLAQDLNQLAKQFVNLSLQAGSQDNVSCQLLRIDALGKEQASDVYQKLGDLSFPPFLEPGMVLDDLKVIREIYASTRSQLYVVEDIESGERFCMKTPSINFEDDAAYIERFLLESWVGKRINHSNVVKVVEPGRGNKQSCLYYLTEYLDGITLSQWMKEHPSPPVQEVTFLLDQVAKGLRALHRKETLHQDVKPDNIMVDASGMVKIIDFGSCYIGGVVEIDVPFVRDIALGTASYSAPEYTLKQKPGPQADIFSLAVIAYEMLTGELPFSGKLEDCKTAADFLATEYTPAYQLNPHVPVWVDGALRKALRYHPERRYQEVSEFVHDLQHPNPVFVEREFQPLLYKDPLTFWKGCAIFWCAAFVLLLLFCM